MADQIDYRDILRDYSGSPSGVQATETSGVQATQVTIPGNPQGPYDIPPPPPPTPDPSTGDIGGNWQNTQVLVREFARTLTIIASNSCIPVCYGKTKIGGSIIMAKKPASPGDPFTVVYALCRGEIDSVTDLYFGDKTFSDLGLVLNTDYKIYKGTSSQTLDSTLNALDADWIRPYNGQDDPGGSPRFLAVDNPQIAYVWVKIPPTLDVDPLAFAAVGKWRIVRDPRLDPTLAARYYSENPVLWAADYKTASFAGRLEDAYLDWSGSITDSADFCDAFLDSPTNTIRRYSKGGLSIRQQAPAPVIIDSMLAQCMGYAIENSGRYQILIDRPLDPSGIVLSDGSDGNPCNIRESPAVKLRVGLTENMPDAVQVWYSDETQGYKDASVMEPEDGGASTLTGRLMVLHIVGATSRDLAKRLAIQHYNRKHLDKFLDIPLNAEGEKLLPGTLVQVSLERGLTAQDAIVSNVKSPSDPDATGWDVTVVLYDPAAYSDTLQLQDTITPSVPPSPYDAPPNPTSISATQSTGLDGNGKIIPIITIAWANGATPFFFGTRITADDGSGETTLGTFPAGPFVYKLAQFDIPVTFHLYTVTKAPYSKESSGATLGPITPGFGTGTVPDVTGLTTPSTTDDDLGKVYWAASSGAGSENIAGYAIYDALAIGTPLIETVPWNQVPSSSSPLRLRPFVHGSATTGYSFKVLVKAFTRSSPPLYSPGVTSGWSLPPSAVPFTIRLIPSSSGADYGTLKKADASWSTARGGSADATDSPVKTQDTFQSGVTYGLWRTWGKYDTSVLPDDASILAAKWIFTENSIRNDDAEKLIVDQGLETSDPPAVADWTRYSGINGGELPAADWPTGASGQIAIPLNSTGIGWISVTGPTRLCLRTENDFSNTAPATGHNNFFAMVGSPDVSQLPILEIQYTSASQSGSYSGGGSTITALTVAETPDDVRTAFTLPLAPAGILLMLDRAFLVAGVDYTLSGTTLTFTVAPSTGSSIGGLMWS